MSGIAVISNPHSRGNRKNPVISEEIRAILGADGMVLETASIAEIDGVVEQCLRQNVDIIAINGGDGTLHSCISRIAPMYAEAGRELPLVALLRGGTMNTIAKGMKTISGTPLSIISRVADKYRRGERFFVAERHALDINDGQELGFLFGIGLPANFLDAYYEGKTTGPAKGAYVLGRLVMSTMIWGPYARKVFHRVPAFVAAGGGESPYENYTAIMAATVTEIGLGFSLFSRTLERENNFLVIAAAISPISYVAQLGSIYTGAPLKGAVFEKTTNEALIELRSDTSYMIDGDVKRGIQKFRLRAGPKVKFIQS